MYIITLQDVGTYFVQSIINVLVCNAIGLLCLKSVHDNKLLCGTNVYTLQLH